MAGTCSSRRRACCGAVGVVCLLGGVVGLCLYRTLLDAYVTQLMALRDGEFIYRRWKDPPYPIYTQFYFFDLLNKDEVLNGAKPAFLEKGPYTYREVRHKVNVTFHGNDTLSYVDLKSYSFVPRMSAGSENDSFTSINIAAMTLSEWIENERDLVKDLTSLLLLLTGESLFVTHTVGEMLAGYHEPLLTLAKTFAPALIKDDTFGIFRIMGGQFNASDGVYTIYSGQADPRKYTYIDRWNGMREVNFWNKTGTCNMINGTVGTMYPIIQDTSEPIYVFQSDMCRSVHAVFESARTVRGIPVYRYTARPGLMQSGDNNPDNRCFCLGTCLPDGLMDGRSCHQGKQQPRQPLLLSAHVSAGRTHGRAVLSPRCAHSAVPAAFLPGRRAAAGLGLGPETRQTQTSDLPRHRTDYRTGDERGQTSADQHGRQTSASHQGNRKNTEAVLPGPVAKRDGPGGPHVRGPV
ncbi:scavenger receptor class B member 1-like [Branchiostoma lanceolatum]|uniref:scavenger receptor class B member 1-like n=1 Tax=Branchiostoma lanceolatum TaxID=7740 RepID=UPI0034563CD0